MGELTRDKFMDLLDFMLTKVTDPKESEKIGIRKFIPKHIAHVPEIFKKVDINIYMNTEVLSNIMHDFIDEKYPGKEGIEMKEQITRMKGEKQKQIDEENAIIEEKKKELEEK